MGSYVIYKAKVICIKPGDDPLQEVFFFFHEFEISSCFSLL